MQRSINLYLYNRSPLSKSDEKVFQSVLTSIKKGMFGDRVTINEGKHNDSQTALIVEVIENNEIATVAEGFAGGFNTKSLLKFLNAEHHSFLINEQKLTKEEKLVLAAKKSMGIL